MDFMKIQEGINVSFVLSSSNCCLFVCFFALQAIPGQMCRKSIIQNANMFVFTNICQENGATTLGCSENFIHCNLYKKIVILIFILQPIVEILDILSACLLKSVGLMSQFLSTIIAKAGILGNMFRLVKCLHACEF